MRPYTEQMEHGQHKRGYMRQVLSVNESSSEKIMIFNPLTQSGYYIEKLFKSCSFSRSADWPADSWVKSG